MLAVESTKDLNYLKSSGVIGFGPRSVSLVGAPLFMDTMYKHGAITKNIFSVYLTDYLT